VCFVFGLIRNAWHVTAITCILLSSVVNAEHHWYRSRGLRPRQQKEGTVEADQDLEEDVELTAQVAIILYNPTTLSFDPCADADIRSNMFTADKDLADADTTLFIRAGVYLS
jgi:hypothetical protein